jgi:hypothetical protein
MKFYKEFSIKNKSMGEKTKKFFIESKKARVFHGFDKFQIDLLHFIILYSNNYKVREKVLDRLVSMLINISNIEKAAEMNKLHVDPYFMYKNTYVGEEIEILNNKKVDKVKEIMEALMFRNEKERENAVEKFNRTNKENKDNKERAKYINIFV